MNELRLFTKSKELRYVTVYNILFKMISEGTFPENSRLPSEPDLAKELGVSRTTLRQSLSLLQDDGLIKNIRGKGNFITKRKANKKSGLETTCHVVYKSIEETINKVNMDFKIEPPSDYFTKVLEKKSVAIVSIDRWYQNENNTLAYSFTIIPIETISSLNIDLNNNDEILNFVENKVYNQCSDSTLEIKFSTSSSFATKQYSFSCDKQFYLIEEKIYMNSNTPILVNKHYLPLQYATIKFHPRK